MHTKVMSLDGSVGPRAMLSDGGFKNVDWSFWFAVSSPILGALLGWLGVFILAR